MSLTVHHYTTTTSIDRESLLCAAKRLAFDGKWLAPAFRRTLRLNFDAQWEYAIPPPVFDVGNRTNEPLRDWGDLEEDEDEGKGLEELEEWVPWSREGLRPPVQEFGDIEMDEADRESQSLSTRLIPETGSNGKSKYRPISQSNSTKARLENNVDLDFTRGADYEGFDEADTGFHIDEDEMEEDMSFGFVLSGQSGVSYDWGDDKQVDEDEINTGFIEDEGPSTKDEAGMESGVLPSSQDSKTKDFHLSRRVSDALRDMEDNAVFERGWSSDADTGFHVKNEDEDEEDDYMDSQFFLPSVDHGRSDDEANPAPLEGNRNPSSVDASLPDVPIELPDESPDFAMLDEDENEDANTGFIDFKAALDTDEEDEEEDIDSRFILSDGDIQYHHGSISEILDADDFTVQDVKEEEEGEMEKHIEGEYEEDKISEWVDEDDSQVHSSENASGDYEYKGHPSRLIPIPQTIISRLLTSPVHTPKRFLTKYQSLSTRVESLGSGLGWIIPVTTPGGIVLIDGHESPGCWTPRSLAAFWGFLGTLHEETGMGVVYDFFGGRGYFFKLYHCAGLSVLLRGRLDEWVWRDGEGEGEVRMFKGLRLLLRDSVNKEVGFW